MLLKNHYFFGSSTRCLVVSLEPLTISRVLSQEKELDAEWEESEDKLELPAPLCL